MSTGAHFSLDRKRVTRRGALAGLALVGAAMGIAACSSGGGSTAAPPAGGAASTGGAAATAAVTMADDNKFNPATVTISKGGTVTWTNKSATMPHSVTCDPSKAANAADVAVPAGAQPFDSNIL